MEPKKRHKFFAVFSCFLAVLAITIAFSTPWNFYYKYRALTIYGLWMTGIFSGFLNSVFILCSQDSKFNNKKIWALISALPIIAFITIISGALSIIFYNED